MMTAEQFNSQELKQYRAEVARTENAPLSERKEGQRDYLNMLKNDPERFEEDVYMLLVGNFGHGAQIVAHDIIKSPRINQTAGIAIMIAHLNFFCPNELARKAWNMLTPEEQAKVNNIIKTAIADYKTSEEGIDALQSESKNSVFDGVLITEKKKKWSGKVKIEKEVFPEDFFTQSAEKIAKGLKSRSDSLKQAVSRLNFYRNRAGKNLSAEDKKRLENAMEKLHKLYPKSESANLISAEKFLMEKVEMLGEVTRMVEMNDNLDEIKKIDRDEVREKMMEYMKENPDEDNFDYFSREIDDDIHEMVDGSVPVYTNQIKTLWYLYENDFEDAYENAGIGDGNEENHKEVAIYCYLEQELREYIYGELKDEWEDLVEKRGEGKDLEEKKLSQAEIAALSSEDEDIEDEDTPSVEKIKRPAKGGRLRKGEVHEAREPFLSDIPYGKKAGTRKEGLIIYRDIDNAGESYTIYKDGKFVDGPLLSDDITLKKIVPEGDDWEDYVVDGLDNRDVKESKMYKPFIEKADRFFGETFI